MAHLTRPKGDPIKIAEGPASVNDIYSVIKNMGEPQPGQFFYELEPAEVINVFLDSTDLTDANQLLTNPKTGKQTVDWSKYGHIEARLVYSKENVDDVKIIAPMDSNIKEYPRPGEYVIVANYFGEFYYTTKLNMFNSVNLNANPGMSRLTDPLVMENYRIKQFKGNSKIRQIKSYEGDITFNGRFGQSIRFGSNVTELYDGNGDLLPDSGKPQSPNIKIRAGQGVSSKIPNRPILENINIDGSSLYLTTNEAVPLKHHASKVKDLTPKFFDGKQIVLNSDRIVFNSKGTDIFAYSNKDINLVSKNRIVLEAHENVYLGSAPRQGETTGWIYKNPQIQPILKGDETMNLVGEILQKIIQFATDIAPTKGAGGVMVPVALDMIAGAANGLVGSLTELKTRLDEPKSEIVKTI